MVETQIANERDYRPSDSFTLQCLKGKGYKRGEGTKSALRGDSRRKMNQLLCETVSINTLRWTVARRAEQTFLFLIIFFNCFQFLEGEIQLYF